MNLRCQYKFILYKAYADGYRRDSHAVLLTRQGVTRILTLIRSSRAAGLAEQLGVISLKDELVTIRQDSLKILMDIFRDHRIKQRHLIGGYRTDLFFPDYNLAVECGEITTAQDPNDDIAASVRINSETYTLIRYNPFEPGFNLAPIAHAIYRFIATKTMCSPILM
jgi:hypothetical protein